MPAEQLLYFILILTGATVIWWLLVKARPGQKRTPAARSSPNYFKGLTLLLEDKPDKAIEVFISLMDVDNETVETHFALGSLFRRRGEVDRAIRIHQNIIARPNLERAQRDQALFALGEDYLRAGLLDRAEKLFEQLGAGGSLREPALEKLIGIYEQQQDWQHAIASRRRKSDARSAENARILAHYHCELADEVLARHDYGAARTLLKKAKSAGTWLLRGALMRAAIAQAEGDVRTAARLYRRIVERDASVLPLVWPGLRESVVAADGAKGFAAMLENLVRTQPGLEHDIAYAAILHGDSHTPVAARCVSQFVVDSAPLRNGLVALGAWPEEGQADDAQIERAAAALRELLAYRPGFLCGCCGYASDRLYWQCPGCRNWDTIRPNVPRDAERLALMPGQ